MNVPAPVFDPPPQPPGALSESVDLNIVGAAVQKINTHLRFFTVWITQQLSRVAWVLRYNGLHIGTLPVAGTVANTFVTPFRIGITGDGVPAGILLSILGGTELIYTPLAAPPAGYYTLTAPNTILTGTAGAVRWQWVMEGA